MASVRMGEMAISTLPGEELVAIGLGSCIGLVVMDSSAGVAALAHIVLPDSQGGPGPAAKFADLAVPEVLRQVQRAGARRPRLLTAIAGGAAMFEFGGGLDIGARNAAAVCDALSKEGVRLDAQATGGNCGRTIRVRACEGKVTVHEAGGKAVTLLDGRPGRHPAATVPAAAVAAAAVAAPAGAAPAGAARTPASGGRR